MYLLVNWLDEGMDKGGVPNVSMFAIDLLRGSEDLL